MYHKDEDEPYINAFVIITEILFDKKLPFRWALKGNKLRNYKGCNKIP